MEFAVEFFVRNPFYATVKADSKDEAERIVAKRFEDVDAFMDDILAYLNSNEFNDAEYDFGTTLVDE